LDITGAYRRDARGKRYLNLYVLIGERGLFLGIIWEMY